MTALVIGASGLVGGALQRVLGPLAVGTYLRRRAPGLRHLDASDPRAVAALMDAERPDVVYLPAGEPNVDWCEQHPCEARALNVYPARATLEAARTRRATVVFFSSDYVFDGSHGPYGETDAPRPLSVYGRIKREIEQEVLDAGGTVVRTTTVFGRELPPGKNFAIRVVARLRAGDRVQAPGDQISTPTWSDDLARAAVTLPAAGIWHVAGPDLVARDEFARRIARAFDLDAGLVDAVSTSSLGQVAARPALGGLRTDKLAAMLGIRLTPLDRALELFREQMS